MTIDDHPSDEPRDPVTELALTAALADLVAGEQPAEDVRERVADGLAADTALRRRWIPLAAAAAVVAIAVLGAVVGLGPDDGDTDIATVPSPTTEPEPEVLGDRIEREPTATTTTSTTAPAVIAATTTTTVVDAPAPPAPLATSPPTTAPVCRNSTDPACGAFRWDPAPADRPATLTITPQAGPIVAGQRVDFTLAMSDPDGPVTLAEWDIAVNPGTAQYGSSSTVERPPACPARYGPWTPPPPNGGEASTLTNILFEQPGTYTITVDVRPAAGCDNVDPYRSGARRTITVEVEPAA